MSKKALITGITGQDGSYLTEFLLNKGYEVHGVIRRASNFNTQRIDHLYNDSSILGERLFLHYGDMIDASSLNRTLEKAEPDEIYNLAAQSHVKVSFEMPDYTEQVNGLGVIRFLDALNKPGISTKFYQASTSELFGNSPAPQSEETPFSPESPYGYSKLTAYNAVVNSRKSFDTHASNGVLFNHESERRGETFVTRKITRGLTRIKRGLQAKLTLGNLNAKRDWGYAPDFVEAMWLILQQEKSSDYVIGTGETRTIRKFLENSAEYLDMKISSNGREGIEEKYFDEKGNVVVDISPSYFRPSEVNHLLANAEKSKKILGWEPRTNFDSLVQKMCDFDLELAGKEIFVK